MLKVVVIDANAISRNLLTSVLVGGGHDVVGDATTSPAGIAGMIKLRPQLVCIDIGQPDDAGLEKLDAIRTGLPKALIFMVSANLDPASVQTALARGVHGFIVKPFNGATVLTSIRNTILKLAKQHRAVQGSDASASDAA